MIVKVAPPPPPEKEPWSLEQSIWAPRKKWCDALDFWDTDEVERKKFEWIWQTSRQEQGLDKLIMLHDDAGGGGDPAEDGGVRRGGAGVAAGGREREAAEGGVGEGGGGGQARDLVFLFAGAVGAVGERGEVVDAVLGGIVGAGAVSPAGGSAGGRRASEKF